jgi:ribonuclease BN (tRNA processing enzyme)
MDAEALRGQVLERVPEDTEQASSHHTTVTQVAELARRSGAGRLELLHRSRRDRPEQWAHWFTHPPE